MNEYENYLNYKNIINTSDDLNDIESYSSQNEIETIEIIEPNLSATIKSQQLNDIESCCSENEIETIEIFKTNYLATSKSQKGHIITKRILEWSKSLTAHGFPKLFITKRITVKFLWSLALIVSISYCILNIYNSKIFSAQEA